MQCSCKRGVMSNWDFKCGHCRTKADWAEHALMMLNAKQAPGVITVVNRHHNPDKSKIATVYIGRGRPLGNPFQITPGGMTRQEVIAKYKLWLVNKIAERDKTVCDELNLIANLSLDGFPVQLECFCAPCDCHGHFIKAMVDNVVRNELINPST